MKPGRELDALIAEKVFGAVRTQEKFQGYVPIPGDPVYYSEVYKYPTGVNYLIDDPKNRHGMMGGVPHYSTDISAAWEVVEKLNKQYSFHLNTKGSADTAPHAICLAALKAVGHF